MKKLLTIALCLAVCLSLLPVFALAEEEEPAGSFEAASAPMEPEKSPDEGPALDGDDNGGGNMPDLYVSPGETVTLSVEDVVGAEAAGAKWFGRDFNGTMSFNNPIPGAEGLSYTVTVNTSAEYACVIYDANGRKGGTYWFRVYVGSREGKPRFSNGMDSFYEKLYVPLGETAELTVDVKAGDMSSVTYWWECDGSRIEGAESDRFTTPPIKDNQFYYCHVQDPYGNYLQARFDICVENHLVISSEDGTPYFGSDSANLVLVKRGETVTLRAVVSADDMEDISCFWWAGNNYMGDYGEFFLTTSPIEEKTTCTINVTDKYGNDNSFNWVIMLEEDYSSVPIDEEHFPDDNFREFVSRRYDQDHDGILTNLENGENYLNCNDEGITSLQGIEYFRDVRYLRCSGNQLTSLDLSGLQTLEYLDCSNNQLTSLDVEGLPNLEQLICFDNQLTSLKVSDCPVLEELYCSNNQLTSLDVSKCPALRRLHCNNNLLTNLNLDNCAVLEQLYCVGNRMTSLDVSICPVLFALVREGEKQAFVSSRTLGQGRWFYEGDPSDYEMSRTHYLDGILKISLIGNSEMTRYMYCDSYVTVIAGDLVLQSTEPAPEFDTPAPAITPVPLPTAAPTPMTTPEPSAAPTPEPAEAAPAVVLSEDAITATASNFAGLYARVALVLDNNGVSGLYVTQATINTDGTVVIPSFQVPGLQVTGISIALVPTLADIQKSTPDVKASDMKML